MGSYLDATRSTMNLSGRGRSASPDQLRALAEIVRLNGAAEVTDISGRYKVTAQSLAVTRDPRDPNTLTVKIKDREGKLLVFRDGQGGYTDHLTLHLTSPSPTVQNSTSRDYGLGNPPHLGGQALSDIAGQNINTQQRPIYNDEYLRKYGLQGTVAYPLPGQPAVNKPKR